MATDYIPNSDGDFDDFQRQFITFVAPNVGGGGTWNIPQPPFNALLPLQTTWDAKWAIAQDEDSRTRADVQGKDDAREAYEAALRAFVREWITPNNNITDQQRRDMNITVPDTERTRVPVPQGIPQVVIKKFEPLRHTLRITDPDAEDSRAKPDGVRAAQVFRFFGDADPGDNSAYTFYGNATRFSFKVNFEAADRGRLVWYIARWENTRGETGDWSLPVSGTVA